MARNTASGWERPDGITALQAVAGTLGETSPTATRAGWPGSPRSPSTHSGSAGARTTTSGAAEASTVPRSVWILPKSLTTTCTSTPRALPHVLVTLSTSAFRFWSDHTMIVVAEAAAALCAPYYLLGHFLKSLLYRLFAWSTRRA